MRKILAHLLFHITLLISTVYKSEWSHTHTSCEHPTIIDLKKKKEANYATINTPTVYVTFSPLFLRNADKYSVTMTTRQNKTWTETKTPTATSWFYIFKKKKFTSFQKQVFSTRRLNSFDKLYKHWILVWTGWLEKSPRKQKSNETHFVAIKKKDRYLCMYIIKKKTEHNPWIFTRTKRDSFFVCVKKRKNGEK